MNSKFKRTARFERSIRQLKKRYSKIGKDLIPAFEALESDGTVGVVIPPDFNIRKLRVASSDMQRGKSGGFRLLYKTITDDSEELVIVLLYLYAKTDQSDVPATFLETLQSDIDEI